MKVTLRMHFNQLILQLYLGYIIDSVIDHTIIFSKYNPLSGISNIELPKELSHPRKGLINIQNIDDTESFK